MGGKGGGGPSQAEINQQAYSAGQAGSKWVDITGQIPYGHDQALEAWKQGQKARPQMPTFEFPEMGGGMPIGPSYEERQADAQKQYEQQVADQERMQGEADRDQLYSGYLDAANTATEYVTSEIAQEQANAALLGIDYTIDDAMKSQRINDYFATIWGEGEQSRLEALMGKWGNPTGFQGFSVVRGDPSSYAGTEASEETVATSGPIRPGTLITEDEDALGQTTSTGLGV